MVDKQIYVKCAAKVHKLIEMSKENLNNLQIFTAFKCYITEKYNNYAPIFR
jgi:hypothetical protein